MHLSPILSKARQQDLRLVAAQGRLPAYGCIAERSQPLLLDQLPYFLSGERRGFWSVVLVFIVVYRSTVSFCTLAPIVNHPVFQLGPSR